MLKVTSSLYTWIYFGFDTLRTMQYFSWGERSTHFAGPCMIFFFFLFGCNFSIQKIKNKIKINLEFECRRVINFIFISCDEMNNAELVILFVILRLFHEEHNWKLLSTIEVSGQLDVGYVWIMNKLDINWNSIHIENSWALLFFVRVYLCLNS